MMRIEGRREKNVEDEEVTNGEGSVREMCL